MILELIIGILTLVAEWMIFKKMGRQGWEGIVPFYNTYVLCQELYGNGWKFLLLLIPIYNIYFVIKMNIDWAKAFNQGVGFGIGLLLLPFIFQLILAFGGDQYRDGIGNPCICACESTDEITGDGAGTDKRTGTHRRNDRFIYKYRRKIRGSLVV